MNLFPKIIDLYPLKAQFSPNDELRFAIILEGTTEQGYRCQLTVSHLHKPIMEQTMEIQTDGCHYFVFPASELSLTGYGIEATLLNPEGKIVSQASSAFDIATHWSEAPRYGFLCGFHPDEYGDVEDVEQCNKYHLNVIQFYDWMYRHDQLVPEEKIFTDPLGRTLSLEVVKEKIETAHQKGMATLAYGAIYASLKDFFDQHSEWGLYQNDGLPYSLADLFFIMDISPGSPWNEHIINEFKKAIQLGFDGIHLDQYGYPRRALNAKKEVVDLAKAFTPFINQTKQELQAVRHDVDLIFNNVSNFPTYATAHAQHEAVYIEVWAPVSTYRELKQLIDQTKLLNKEKHVILAAYLAPFHLKRSGSSQIEAENGALTTMATIFASGAYHLLLGEKNNVLTEGYYPNYGEMSPSFQHKVRKYYDFIVRYRELLFSFDLQDLSFTHTGGYVSEIGRDNEVEVVKEGVVCAPNGSINTIWTIVKENEKYLMIHLINLVGLDNDLWNGKKSTSPIAQENIQIRILIEEEIEGVFLASPDQDGMGVRLETERVLGTNGYMIQVTVPRLDVWSVVYVVKS